MHLRLASRTVRLRTGYRLRPLVSGVPQYRMRFQCRLERFNPHSTSLLQHLLRPLHP